MDSTEEKKRRESALRKNGAYDGQASAAVVGAIIGMLAGILPAVLWAIAFGRAAYPLYAVPPLAMFCFIALLRGCRDIRAVIITAVLSLLGAYLTMVSVEAAIYARTFGMSVLSIPLVAISSIGRAELLPGAASGYVFPLLFTALGAVLSCQLLVRHGRAPEAAIAEETPEE